MLGQMSDWRVGEEGGRGFHYRARSISVRVLIQSTNCTAD